MPEIPLSNGRATLVDDADFEYLSQWNWHFSHGYARRCVKQSGKVRVIYMHRVIAKPAEDEEVDHANMDSLDNRRSNLRCCNRSQNNCNHLVRRDNFTGLKGVKFDKRTKVGKPFVARITIFGKCKHLGSFKTAEEAHAAYVAAQPPRHGQFSRS